MRRARPLSCDVLTFCGIALSLCLLGIFACFYLITWEDRLAIAFPKQPGFGSITDEKWWSKLEDRVERIYFRYDRVVVSASETFRERFRNLRAVDPKAAMKNGQLQQFNPRVSTTNKCGSSTRFLSCKEIREIEIIGEIGHGYSKVVERGFYKGEGYAVKSVRRASKDVERCVGDSQSLRSVDECMKLSKYKLAKEMILLQELQHSNIVQLRGFCWQNELNTADIRTRGLTMVTELGEPIGVINLLQMPWHQRFRISLGLSRLVKYLERSPLGSLLIRDFKLPQFILVSGEVKLSDLDDVDNEEPTCESEDQCIVGTASVNRTLPCVERRCVGHNAVTNLKNICQFFLFHILLPDAPKNLKNSLKSVLRSVKSLEVDSNSLVSRLESILSLLEAGKHIIIDGSLNIQPGYHVITEADFPGMHDYYCTDSHSLASCELAVFSLQEAKYQCNVDPHCKAFVVTSSKTWIGYTIIFLKSNSTHMRYNEKTVVFVKSVT